MATASMSPTAPALTRPEGGKTMNLQHTRTRTTALAVLVPAVTALAVTVLGASPGQAGASAPATSRTTASPHGQESRRADPAPFTLWAPARVEITLEPGADRIWTDLGIRAVAGPDPVEVRSHRATWSSPITTTWTAGTRSGTAPTGLQRNFEGLTNFVRLEVRSRSGQLVLTRRVDGCFNNGAERTRPDAPATSPYPLGCPWNPFTVGSVQGIQAGWASPIAAVSRPLRLGRGRYDVTISVNQRWADAFGLPAEARSRTTRLVVTEDAHSTHDHPRANGGSPVPDLGPHPSPVEPASPTSGRVADGPRPDLRSLPAFGIELNARSTHLRFSATVWNAGDSPLVVDGFRRETEDVMDAYQYFFDTDGDQVGYQQVGELHYHHANHQHWHFEDFARYRLLRADRTEATTSGKVSFCLANTDAVDLTVPGAQWRPETTDLSTACGEPTSLAVREVLASGSGDTYAQYRAGQSFRIEGLPNGWYWIAVEANPSGRLVEQSTTNNRSLRRIHLGGRPGARTVTVPQVGLVEEEYRVMR